MSTEVNNLIQQYGLLAHPEGGYYAQTYKSAQEVELDGYDGARATSTAILFLLRENDISAFHRLKSDETWHCYAGGTATLHMIDKDRKYTTVLLGSPLMEGAVPQYVVPAGTMFAVSVNDGSEFAFFGCTVSPGFDFKDFELPSRKELYDMYPDKRELVDVYGKKEKVAIPTDEPQRMFTGGSEAKKSDTGESAMVFAK